MSLATDMNKLGEYTPAPEKLLLFMQLLDRTVVTDYGTYDALWDKFNMRDSVLYACIHDGAGKARFNFVSSLAMITP